jgi:lysozyme family protein
MMLDFAPIFAWTISWEGKVLEQVPGDPGGLTFWGIAREVNPSWPGWPLVDQHMAASSGDIKGAGSLCNLDPSLTGLAQGFYGTAFAKGDFGAFIYPELGLQVFDKSWNMGGRAIKALQMILMIKADGILGPETITAANDHLNPSLLVDQYLDAIRGIYQGIVLRHPDMEKFLKGWLNRCRRSDVAAAETSAPLYLEPTRTWISCPKVPLVEMAA